VGLLDRATGKSSAGKAGAQMRDLELLCTTNAGMVAALKVWATASPSVIQITNAVVVAPRANVRAASGHQGGTGERPVARMEFTDTYPGCPHCGNTGVVRCATCGELGCAQDQSPRYVCPECGAVAQVEWNGIDVGVDEQGDGRRTPARRFVETSGKK